MMKSFNELAPRKFEYKKGQAVLHGDVILYCEDLPENFNDLKKSEDNILAYGEVTGHVHQLFGDSINFRDNFLKLESEAVLKHQEHASIIIPPGTYRIGIQREYDHFEEIIREVAD